MSETVPYALFCGNDKCPDFRGQEKWAGCYSYETCPYYAESTESDVKAKLDGSVVHPAYYQGPHECIDLMKALFGKEDVMAFCRCNSFKYRFRAGRKDGSPAEEDLKKAEFYEDLLIEMHKGESL